MKKEIIDVDLLYYLTNKVGVSKASANKYLYQIKRFVREGKLVSNHEALYQNIGDFVKTGRKTFSLYALRHLFIYLGMEKTWKIYYRKFGKKLCRQPDRLKTNKSLNIDEIKKLIAACSEEDGLIIKVQVETGARIAEILKLTSDDIKQDAAGNVDLSIIEKGKSRRIVSITNQNIGAELLSYLEKRKNEDKIFKPKYETFRHHLNKVSEAALGKRVTSHFFRHSRGVWVYFQTHDVLKVQKVLGHKRIENTLKYLESAGVLAKDVLLENKIEW